MRQAFPELLLEAHIPMATQNARRRWMLDQRQAFSLMFWVPGIAMIRLNFQLKLNYQVLEHDADFSSTYMLLILLINKCHLSI